MFVFAIATLPDDDRAPPRDHNNPYLLSTEQQFEHQMIKYEIKRLPRDELEKRMMDLFNLSTVRQNIINKFIKEGKL